MDAVGNCTDEVGRSISQQSILIDKDETKTTMDGNPNPESAIILHTRLEEGDHDQEKIDSQCKHVDEEHDSTPKIDEEQTPTSKSIELEKKEVEAEESPSTNVNEKTEQSMMRKLSLRILPILCISSIMFSTNRTQLTLAAEGMMEDLQLNTSQFGVCISCYSFTYAFLSVPAAAICARIGICHSLAIMLLAFGSISMATAAVNGYGTLIVARLALGVAQAGWQATIASYNARFFGEGMSRAMALSQSLGFTLAQVLPLGAGILYAFRQSGETGNGLRDWQYLFILEGIPTIILAPIVYFILPSSPGDVMIQRILTEEERACLNKKTEASEEARRQKGGKSGSSTMWTLIRNERVVILAIAACMSITGYTGTYVFGVSKL